MSFHHPPHADFAASLELPPVPFARTSPHAPGAPTVGTSVDDLLDALRLDGTTLDGVTMRHDVATPRPHAEFSTSVERRAEWTERRRGARSTPDRRMFQSEHLAPPAAGPVDPRPQVPPPSQHAVERAAPIDHVMPELPFELEPSLPFTLSSRGVAVGTQRTTRPNVAVTQLPFPAMALKHPTAPVGAPEPPTAPPAPAASTPFPAPHDPLLATTAQVQQHAPLAQVQQRGPLAQPAPEGARPAAGISGIFGGMTPIPVGRLEPHAAMPHASALIVPHAGPAGPAIAPGAGLHPIAAAVAATPSAWHGGAVHVDDALLVWNAPGTTAPLAPSVAAMIAPQPVSGSLASAPAAAAPGVATTVLLPSAPAGTLGGATGAGSTARLPLATMLRWLLLVGVPTGSGLAIAFAVNRFLL